MPNAIQPHWVLVVSSFCCEATAAPATAAPAGLTPDCVVCAAAAVWVGTAVVVWTTVDASVRVTVRSVVAWGVVGVERVGLGSDPLSAVESAA
jgi:hypothetical protein